MQKIIALFYEKYPLFSCEHDRHPPIHLGKWRGFNHEGFCSMMYDS